MDKKLTKTITKNNQSNYEVLDNAFYSEITNIIAESRERIYRNIDFELVMANWHIGKMLDEKQNSFPRAEYGKKLIEELSTQMIKDFGIGYSKRNLEMMRKFFRTFPIPQTLSAQLSWTHITLVLKVKNDTTRNFYINECIKNRWSARQLAREIHNISYERYIIGNKNYAIIQETADKVKEEKLDHLVTKEPRLFKENYSLY